LHETFAYFRPVRVAFDKGHIQVRRQPRSHGGFGHDGPDHFKPGQGAMAQFRSGRHQALLS